MIRIANGDRMEDGTMLFYHISENTDGGFTYREFISGWNGYRPFACNDVYLAFGDREAAERYAKQRGGKDAYSY